MNIQGIVTVIRIPFLILSLILGVLGAAVAWYESRNFGSPFNMGYAVFALVGLLIAHAAVNIFNEYFDARSGLDYRTRRTPFSGGSGLIRQGKLTPREVFWFGMVCLLIDVPIGLYFCITKGWLLLQLETVKSNPTFNGRPVSEYMGGMSSASKPK